MSNERDEPSRFIRILKQPEFWLIMVTTMGGMIGGRWWVFIPLCVAGLSISALPKYLGLWRSAAEAGAESVWWQTIALSLLNSIGAACGGFLVGIVKRAAFV